MRYKFSHFIPRFRNSLRLLPMFLCEPTPFMTKLGAFTGFFNFEFPISFSFELIAFISVKDYRFFLESHISGNTRTGKCQQNRTSKFFLDLYFSFIFLRKFIHPWPVFMCLFFLVNLIMRLFNQLYSFLHKTLKKLLLNRNWNIKIVQWMDYNIYSPNVCNIYTPNPRGTSILNFLVPSLTILPH